MLFKQMRNRLFFDRTIILKLIARRPIADQELLALIAPLAKLGRFEVAADFFRRLCITISLPSGAIRANTSWLAIVLLAYCVFFKIKVL